MTLAQLRDKADAKLATFWSVLVTKQEAYRAKHGRFFQLLQSPETIVVDGVDTAWELRPSPVETNVVDIDLPTFDTVPYSIEVQAWQKQDRVGFEARVFVKLPNGNIYTRTRSYETQPDVKTPPTVFGEFATRTPQPPVQIDSGWSQYLPSDMGLN